MCTQYITQKKLTYPQGIARMQSSSGKIKFSVRRMTFPLEKIRTAPDLALFESHYSKANGDHREHLPLRKAAGPTNISNQALLIIISSFKIQRFFN